MATPFSLDQPEGRRLAGLDFGGDGPDLLLLHPNGFCAGCFEPIVTKLEGFRCVALDACGHGASDPPADLRDLDLTGLAADVVAALDHLGLRQVAVVGHSLGGATAVALDALAPGRLLGVLLCEAVIFPRMRQPPRALLS